MPRCFVEDDAPGDPKFHLLAEFLNIDHIWAFGLAVSLWCLCWRRDLLDGKLRRYTPKMIAEEIHWKKDPAKIIKAMLDAEVLVREQDGTLVVKNWAERQGPLVNKRQADKDRAKQERLAKAQAASDTPAATGSSTPVKILLDAMRTNHITGSAAQKREHAEAWHAAGLTQKAEELIMGAGKNKDIFWLARSLNGTPQKSGGQVSSVEAELKKWVAEGDKKP